MTSEEGGAHLRISFWYLLMNLKNNYLFKKLLHFLNSPPPPPPWKSETQNFQKMKNLTIDIILHVHQKTTVIWSTVPETRSKSDRIFCHSELFFALLPPKNLENQNFLKMKKLKKHLEMSSFYTRVPNVMIIWYEIWSTTDTIFCHFGSCFALLPHQWHQKLKFWKNKKTLEISSFYTCAQQKMIIWCTVPEILSTRDKIVCHFGSFFALLPP